MPPRYYQPPRSATARRGERGFTLLEILVVTAIIGTLLALGVGGYMALARGADLQGMASRVRSVLIHARNTTIYEGAPAAVFIEDVARVELRDPTEFIEGELLIEKDDTYIFDVEGREKSLEVPKSRLIRIEKIRRVRSIGFRTIGMWHLEESDPALGYLGRSANISGGEAYWGKIGTAVLLNPPPDRRSSTTTLRDVIIARPHRDDSSDPFRMPRGGRVELWAFALRPASADGVLAARKGTFELKVESDGTVSGGIPGELLEVEDYYMSYNRWVKFVIEFGPHYVAIYIDDVLRASENREDGTFDPPEKGDLVFGKFFSGVLDEIRVQSRLEGEAFDLHEPYVISGPPEVYFDGRGRLDPTFHTAPVRWELRKGEKSIDVTIETSGRVD
jgi:prepilin-type N-terminal cleavage/methylation domain-containing protein